MLGYMNQPAFEQTRQTGRVTFFSRKRQRLWVKGETSGHYLRVREIRLDCDADAILIQVELTGPGCCHMGYKSCFFRKIGAAGEEIIAAREFDPDVVYGEKQKESQT
jgi:phosphoribosyl-AMP cyclohydrolase